MSRLELRAVSDRALRFAGGSFEPACTVVTGDDGAALATFAAVASGVIPARGSVVLDGKPLARSPEARRRVASLRANEALPAAPDVGSALTRALDARSDRRRAADVLEPFGLGAWIRQRTETLDRDELRCVALALALAHEAAGALVVYEPLSTSLDAARVRERITAAVTRGTVVVLVTASLATAESLGGPHVSILKGVLQNTAGAA